MNSVAYWYTFVYSILATCENGPGNCKNRFPQAAPSLMKAIMQVTGTKMKSQAAGNVGYNQSSGRFGVVQTDGASHLLLFKALG